MSSLQNLRDIRAILRFHRAMGITEYPRSPELERFLDQSRRQDLQALKATKRAGRESTDSTTRTSAETCAILASLQREIESCSRCHLAAHHIGSIYGQGGAGSRLMVVGDWSLQEGGFQQDVLFGSQEDDMLWKMMSAMKLGPKEVFVTNCLKCCPGDGERPDLECEQSCFSFLSREISAVRPQVICAMGETAARLLTGSKDMLVRIRGKFFTCRLQPSIELPVMPTFHPRFLLRNPDMKQATWKDLQAIMRRLAGNRI